MLIIANFIADLYKFAKELEQKYLVNIIERDENNNLTFVRYKGPLDENAEPEHIFEIDDAIQHALKLGWDPNDESDKVCKYSYFLYNFVEYSYLHRRADELQKGD